MGSENSVLRALVTLHDCLLDAGLPFFLDPGPAANGLVGNPPLDRNPAMHSPGTDRDLRRTAGLA